MKECDQCHAKTKYGRRCRRTTCIQYPYCWMHMKTIYGVQVKNSEIPNAGKGLFATKSVKKNKTVAHYSSKEVSTQVDKNSKYVLQLGPRRFLDSQNKLNFVGRYINSNKGTRKKGNVRFSRGTKTYPQFDRQTIPVKTTRKVKKGVELIANYGKQFEL